MTVEIAFHGAAGTVTGSCYRVRHAAGTFLVECGLFQGNRSLRELNLRPFPFAVEDVDYVLLTHAHVDHCGLVPKLSAEGFSGSIYATAPTRDLLTFMLRDSAKIQETDTERRNRWRRREGRRETEPAYTLADAENALGVVRTRPYERWFTPSPGIRVRFWNAGHILGSASLEVEIAQETAGEEPIRILFSGDLGPDEKLFHSEPTAPAGFDYVLCESTYGGVDREDITWPHRAERLRDEIRRALDRGGNLLIPAFALERSQELLHDIGYLLRTGQIPDVPVFLDSPLARKATGVFAKHAASFDDIEVDAKELFRHPSLRIVQSVDQSKAIKEVSGGAIILSASGMCDAGRIKHHLRNNLWRKEATVLFVGYQAPGTLGHILRSGARRVRIHGRTVDVRAAIREISGYSAHADHRELVAWVKKRAPIHKALFLTHGEQRRREALRDELVASGLEADRILLPNIDESFTLTRARPEPHRPETPRVAADALEEDWYNDYASLVLAIGERLEHSADDEERRRIVADLRHALR